MSNTLTTPPHPFKKNQTAYEDVKSIIDNTFKESIKFLSKNIHSKKSQKYFLKISTLIYEQIFYESFHKNSLLTLKANLRLLKKQITYKRELNSSFDDLINPKKMYDDIAFDVIFDILDKTEKRFVLGSYGHFEI